LLLSTIDATNEKPDLEYPASDTPMGLDDKVVRSDVANQTSGNNNEEPYEWTEESLAEFKKYGMVPPLMMQHKCEEKSKVDDVGIYKVTTSSGAWEFFPHSSPLHFFGLSFLSTIYSYTHLFILTITCDM